MVTLDEKLELKYENQKEKKNRKKMMKILIPKRYLREILESLRELLEYVSDEDFEKEIMMNIAMTRKYIRYFEPRDRVMREYFPVSKKNWKRFGR